MSKFIIFGPIGSCFFDKRILDFKLLGCQGFFIYKGANYGN